MLTSRIKRMLWAVLIGGLALYVALLALLYFGQSRLVYAPSADEEGDPGDVGLAFERVAIETPDGLTLDAFYTPHPNPRGTVLFCHGNGGNITHRLPTIRILHDLGFTSLVFDYRGYGRSQGKPDEEGTYTDARAAWDYLVESRGEKPWRIIIQGRSLGAAIAAWLAMDTDPAGLVLESGFSSVPDVAARMYRFVPVRWLCRFRYATIDYVARADCPVLVLHSRDDEMLPFDQSRALYAAASEPKRFVELTGGHNDAHVESGQVYVEALDTFASELAHLNR
jgi:hypothetical protein